tara:strand:+ start:841 stop:1059 length:219 start_codon:yes stop_codon:yes gene_type:complete
MSEKKVKMYNYNFLASETVHYNIDIEAENLKEAQEKLYSMQTEDLNECVEDTSDWWAELDYTDNPNPNEEDA